MEEIIDIVINNYTIEINNIIDDNKVLIKFEKIIICEKVISYYIF